MGIDLPKTANGRRKRRYCNCNIMLYSLSPLSLATDVTDATLGASGLWLGTRTEAGGTVTLTKFFWPQSMNPLTTGLQPMAPWTAGSQNKKYLQKYLFHSFLPSPFLTCYAILPTSFEAMTSRTAFIRRQYDGIM